MPHLVLPRLIRSLTFVGLLALLSACGQGSGEQPVPGTPQTPALGVLLDSPVSGVTWTSTSGASGVTTVAGEFEYLPFDRITFSIGGIELGTVDGAPFVTVVELTNSSSPTTRAATNMLVFLQSIDSDGDASNGITIDAQATSQAAGMAVDFNAEDFDQQIAGIVATLAGPDAKVVSVADALNHFYTTYVSVGGTDTLNFLFPGYPPVGGNQQAYQLIFADEFEVDGPPSPSTWNIETGYGPNNSGWGNNEWQLYTDSPDNLRVEDGNLVIQARCDEPPCGSRDGTITSARITTLDKFNFKFGRVVARIKPPVGTGAWPAFWALGANFPEVGWPRTGEIDFMEMHNAFSDEFTTHSTIHWCDETIQAPEACTFPDGWRFFTQNRTFNESLGDDFQIWEAEWDEERIVMSMNGVQYFERTIDLPTMDEFLEEFFLILNVAMGGTLGSNNQPPSGAEVWPQTMLVDYVRVFQRTGGTSSSSTQVIDFEDDPATYDFGESGGFGGGASSIVPNPVQEGINTSAQVGQMLKFEGEVFAGSRLELADPIDVTSGSTFTMKVWSPREVDVLFKIEGPSEAERTATHSGSGWEELTFDFGSFSGTAEGITLIFDNGTAGDAQGDPDNWTFYFDDITFIPPSSGGGGGGAGALDFPIDFEAGAETYNFGESGGFGGGASFVVANPVPEGINTSAQVAQMLKFEGEVFAGSLLELPNTLEVASGSSFTMKVYSPREVMVLFKLEGATDAELNVAHGGSGWEELTFDFGSYSGPVDGLTFIFDLGIVGDAQGDPDNWTFYFDDIVYIAGEPSDGTDDTFDGMFEDAPAGYNFGADGGFGGGVSDVILNPESGGINTSAQVVRMRKFLGEPFAGSLWTLPSPLEVEQGSQFTMQVWSPREVMVLFKLEGENEAEINLMHGGTGWEELSFDFSSFSGTVTGITVIFDLGIVGDAENDPTNWTFYYDNITLIPPAGGGGGGGGTGGGLAQISLPITFDDPSVDYSVSDFGTPVSAMTSLVADPEDASNRVASTTKPQGAPVWAGTTMSTTAGFASAIPFTADKTTIAVRVYSPDAGVPVRLKADNIVGGQVSVETEVMTTVANAWETLVFDFANPVADTPALDLNVSYTALSIFFNFGTSGDAAGSKTYLWDDVVHDPADTFAPMLTAVSVASNNANPTLAAAGDTVTVSLTADEPISAPSVSIAGQAATVTGADAQWQATRTLTANDAEGAVTFSIVFTDVAGNLGDVVTQSTDASSVTVDLTAPSLAVSGFANALTTLDPVTVSFAFSEDVTGFELSDIVVSNGTATGLVSVDAANYTASITPTADGSVTVNVAADAAQDLAGNGSAAAAEVSTLVDTIAPALTINGVPGDFVTLDPITVTFQFSESVSGFELGDVLVTNGTAAGLMAVDGATYTATVTPDGAGDLTIGVAAAAAIDGAGNASLMAADAVSLIDAVAPTVVVSGVPTDFATLDPISVTFTFSEAVSGFELADITVVNGVASNFASTDATTYTADVTPDGAGDLTVSVAAGAAQDGVGNASVAAADSVSLIDAVAPTVAINGAPADFTTLDAIALTFVFSEAVSGFELTDIAVTNGAASAFVAVDATTYTASVTPTGIGDLTVAVPAGAAQDAVGNDSAAAADVTVTNNLDTEAPLLTAVSIASDNANSAFATAGNTVTITMTANEDIAMPTVTLAGAAAAVTGAGTTWQASRALTAGDAEGVVAFTIDFEDLDGNMGPQSTVTTDGSNVQLDLSAPTLSITGLPATFETAGDALTATFQFSEDVSGFDVSDIAVTNGSAGAFVTVDAATYTAAVTPNGAGDLTVSVAAGAAMDAAGLLSVMPADVVVSNNVDVTPPTLTVVSISSSNADPAQAATGDVVTIAMTASENVAQPTVTIGGAAATVTGADDSWSASRTLLVSDAEGAVAFSIDIADLAGNMTGPITATTDGSAVNFDRTAPTLAISGVPATLTSLDPIAVTFTFSEDVSDFVIGDVAVTNGTTDALVTVNAATYTTNVTPDGVGDLAIDVAMGAATDAAGNGSASAAASATLDLATWQLVWSDDFESGTLADSTNWTSRAANECPDPCPGEQLILASNANISNGSLNIVSTALGVGGSIQTSAFVDSLGKRALTYGRVEIDAILPGTQGMTPILFLLPTSNTYGSWPLSGQIDLTKATDLGVGGNVSVEQALTYGMMVPENTVTSGTYASPVDPAANLVTYAIEWEAGEIRWFVDDVHVLTQTQDNWYTYTEDQDGVYQVADGAAPFDESFYLAFTLIINDDTDGTTVFPQTLSIDEVRVYECANAVDPAAGTGCSTGNPAVTPVSAPDMPYTEAVSVYTDGLATVGFIDESLAVNNGQLVATTAMSDGSVMINSNTAAVDPQGGTVWNLDIDAATGVADALIQAPDFSPSQAFFNLTGGDNASEILFRMRVNSVVSTPVVSVGMEDELSGSGSVDLTYTADGQWQQYSVKLADVLTNSVANATALDLAAITNLVKVSVTGGSINLDIDDIEVKVACRDTNGCQLTPSLVSPVITERYSLNFEDLDSMGTFLNAADLWRYFNTVFENGVYQFDYNGLAPNGPQMSAIVTDQGGPDQGSQQLSIYSDYECCQGSPNTGHQSATGLGTVNMNVFREETLQPADNGKLLTLNVDLKRGNIGGAAQAFVFLKVLNPADGFSETIIDEVEVTAFSADWGNLELQIQIGADWDGQILQYGFRTLSGNFDPSGMFYDNLILTEQ